MTDRDAAALFAETLASTLDSLGHMVWCEGVRDLVPCNYDPCVRVREAVATARELGYLPAKTGDKSGDFVYTGANEIEGPGDACDVPDPWHQGGLTPDA